MKDHSSTFLRPFFDRPSTRLRRFFDACSTNSHPVEQKVPLLHPGHGLDHYRLTTTILTQQSTPKWKIV